MHEMKPCQFCGSKNLDVLKDYDPAIMLSPKRYVHCNQCGADGPLSDDDNEAILKWNSRIQEVPDMPQEKPLTTTWMEAENAYCPLRNGACRNSLCMMWLRIGDNKGRCGLVNTMYINSTGCSAV